MAEEAKSGDKFTGGLVVVVLTALLYSCFSNDDETPDPAPAQAEAVVAPVSAEPAAPPRSAEQQKQAEDFVKATINLNGFLCAKIIDVKPAGGANLFAVNCILNRNGSGSAVYLFDGDTQKVSRL